MVIVLVNSIYGNAQQPKIDSLKKLIAGTKTDTAKIDLYEKLGNAYRTEKKMDSSILSYKQALEINKKNDYSLQGQNSNTGTIAYILYEMGDYSQSVKYAEQQLLLGEQSNDAATEGGANLIIGHDYREMSEYHQSLKSLF